MALPADPSRLRHEVLVVRRRRRAARRALEAYWGELGFVVIQGYGLTETAPIVTLNHPFGTKKGSVGKAIAGVEVKVAPDGEILVRGDNVTQGYFNAAEENARAFEDGWFHTGDIGEIGEGGQLYIRGRKKEMIVTPEGLNVFPEDVEKALNVIPGVRDSAVVGVPIGSEERVHAVLVLDPGIGPRGRGPRGERAPRRSPEDPARGGVAGGRAAAHRRHAETQTRGDSRLGEGRRRRAALGAARQRCTRGADREVRRPRRISRRRRRWRSWG